MSSKQIPSRDGERIMEPTHIPTAPTVESQSQHTPGPWRYRPLRHDDWGFVRAERDLSIVARAHSLTTEDEENAHRRNGTDPHEANGRLITAAPDLLAALKSLMAAIDDGTLVRETSGDHQPAWLMRAARLVVKLCDARAAIAKAEGR